MFTKFSVIALGATAATLSAASALAQSETFEKDLMYSPHGVFTAPSDAAANAFGVRRVDRLARMPINSHAEKAVDVDPATGEVLAQVSTFYLPENWNWAGGDATVDSLNNPIVNQMPGLVGWTQTDVDGLRDAIARSAERVRMVGPNAPEAAAVLGNFIGQAVVRGIAFDDVISIADTSILTPGVVDSIAERMHAYEAARSETLTHDNAEYTPSTYAPEIVALLESHGHLMSDILAVEPIDAIVDRSVPSGCYTRIPGNGHGLNLLVASNVIWSASGVDDAAADVPIGFPFNFYECEDDNVFTGVRVSTNGYLTFYQHGGASVFGLEFDNAPIGAVTAPNGFVAGYWDDFEILNQSAIPDEVSWKIEGAAGSRTLTVEWLSVSRRGGTNTDYHTFQIILHEHRFETGFTHSPITLAYGLPVSYWFADTVDNATVGIEGFEGTAGECIDTCALLTDIPSRNFIFSPLMNDLCEDALPLQIGRVDQGDLTGSHSEFAGCGNGHGDRWYYFDAPCSGTLTVNTCGTHDLPGVDQGVDTLLSAFQGCGPGATLLGCDDDGVTGCNDAGNVRDSQLTIPVVGGDRYNIRVTSFSAIGATGVYQIRASFVPNVPAVNDDCPDALNVNAGSWVGGNLLCATPDGFPECAFSSQDVWFRYNATLGGTLWVSSCGTNDFYGIDRGVDAVLSFHSGCPGTANNQIACNDDALGLQSCGASDTGYILDPIVSASIAGNQQVMIRVGSWTSNYSLGYVQLHTEFLAADLTGDCSVDLTDLATLLTYFGVPNGATIAQGDIDGDSDVDLTDLANLLSRFGTSCP